MRLARSVVGFRARDMALPVIDVGSFSCLLPRENKAVKTISYGNGDRPMRQRAFITLLLGASMLSAPAMAQTLRIALASEPTAVDPHYHELTPNNALAAHIFDNLVLQDEMQALKPGLATSWENDGKNRWTFKLRQGVKF